MTDAHPETDGWDVPSRRERCSVHNCTERAVVDCRSDRHDLKRHRWIPVAFSLCAEHLRRRSREVREGVVWWDPSILMTEWREEAQRAG